MKTKLATVSAETAESWSDALADCLCWFQGYRAGRGRDFDHSEMPPGWRTLSEINLAMKEHLSDIRDSKKEPPRE
jgi:hypothetical protein